MTIEDGVETKNFEEVLDTPTNGSTLGRYKGKTKKTTIKTKRENMLDGLTKYMNFQINGNVSQKSLEVEQQKVDVETMKLIDGKSDIESAVLQAKLKAFKKNMASSPLSSSSVTTETNGIDGSSVCESYENEA